MDAVEKVIINSMSLLVSSGAINWIGTRHYVFEATKCIIMLPKGYWPLPRTWLNQWDMAQSFSRLLNQELEKVK